MMWTQMIFNLQCFLIAIPQTQDYCKEDKNLPAVKFFHLSINIITLLLDKFLQAVVLSDRSHHMRHTQKMCVPILNKFWKKKCIHDE